jgi:hypothetical protein
MVNVNGHGRPAVGSASVRQRVTGGPRCPRMHRVTTTAPLSPPSASNRVPAPVVDLGCALGRGPRGGRTGCRSYGGGGGTPPCALPIPAPAPGWQLGFMCRYRVRRAERGALAHKEGPPVFTGRFSYPNGLGAWGRGKGESASYRLAVRGFERLLPVRSLLLRRWAVDPLASLASLARRRRGYVHQVAVAAT